MIYIKIPLGWQCVQKADATGNMKDVLVNVADGDELPLQDIVKNSLRTKKRNALSVTVDDLTIYFRRPPKTEEQFLQYEPNRNGKLPSENKKMIKGTEVVTTNPALLTTAGQRWFQHMPLSKEKMDEILARDAEVRENRRHSGDNPKAT